MIIPSEYREWQVASVSLFLSDNDIWNVTAGMDAAVARLQVRHYGCYYLAEFRCSIGSAAGHWIPLARFTFLANDLLLYDDVDVDLFPSFATPVFAGLAQFWSKAAVEQDLICAPIQYFGDLPVYYPITGDLSETILLAHLGATPTAA